MGIGVGIFLIALGAILTFAVDFAVGGIDIHAVGVILMVVGVIDLAISFYLLNRRRRVVDPVVEAPLARERIIDRY